MGLEPGQFTKPRAITITNDDELIIVDKLGRIQVFDNSGNFLRQWRTPLVEQGKPCGLSISNDGLLMVADTHYFRVLFYTFDGKLVEERTLGGVNGRGPGEFGFVTDAIQDPAGNYFVSDYGDFDRIQKFDADRNHVMEWGGHGDGDFEFMRPQSLAFNAAGELMVADACNHRIQVFDVSTDPPRLLRSLGQAGSKLGDLQYPYSIWVNPDGSFYVCELGNHRVQLFDSDGQGIATFGRAGRQAGEFHQPWSLVVDHQGIMHVLDTYNHRVQSFRFENVATYRDQVGQTRGPAASSE
jgi:DNA-binding beta-propeller fold protein YncE